MNEPRFQIQYYNRKESNTFHIMDTTINLPPPILPDEWAVNEDVHPIFQHKIICTCWSEEDAKVVVNALNNSEIK